MSGTGQFCLGSQILAVHACTIRHFRMIQNRVVSWVDFRHLVTAPAPGGLGKPLDDDPDQEAAVAAPVNQSLQLIAGPGTGKTTSLTLRVLKLVFVDGVPPLSIVATTFTKKAAGELRSRILGWG